jgi:AraC family transcriptional regulator of arabinose operon
MGHHIFPVITESERLLPLFLTGVGCYYHQEHVTRPEGYPNFQWIQCYNGEGELLLSGKCYSIGPQQGMFLYPNEAHEYYETKEPWEVDWIGFNGCLAENIVHRLRLEKSSVLYVTRGEMVIAKMRQVLKIAQSNDHSKVPGCSGIIYDLLLDLYHYTSRNIDASILQQHSRLQPVFDYIEKNFFQVITLEQLAATIDVTPQHLCLLFKNIIKIRPFEYLNQVRVNKSKDLMLSGRETEIKNIAGMVGFDSVSYFCAVFKRVEGITPGQFRKLYGID